MVFAMGSVHERLVVKIIFKQELMNTTWEARSQPYVAVEPSMVGFPAGQGFTEHNTGRADKTPHEAFISVSWSLQL